MEVFSEVRRLCADPVALNIYHLSVLFDYFYFTNHKTILRVSAILQKSKKQHK